MAIPGLRPELPLRAKVRIGDRTERGAPRSLDHFVCPDPSFAQLAGDRPRELRIRFPYADAAACWSSGLELWLRGRERPILGCYTKGDGTAHRIGRPDDLVGVVLDPKVLGDRSVERKRLPMACPAHECPYFQDEKCRPVARLNFQIEGGPVDSVYRFETKSLTTIELLEGVVGQYTDLRTVVFFLYVERRKKQGKEYSIVGLRQAETANPPASPATDESVTDWRQECVDLLKQLGSWPPSTATAEWITRHGHEAAATALRKKLEAAKEAPDAA